MPIATPRADLVWDGRGGAGDERHQPSGRFVSRSRYGTPDTGS